MVDTPMTVQKTEATGGVFGTKGIAWAIFELARNPYYNVIVIYIFAQYFATAIIGGSERGLTLSGVTISIAGFVTALTAPFLGVIADQAGRRKPAIAVALAVLAICSALLWFSQPGEAGFGIWTTMALLATAYCAYGYSEVLHNAMLPDAGSPKAIPFISGMGLAMGNIASVGILVFFLFGLILTPTPLFGLDPEAFEPQRLSGPFIAVWIVVFIIPFFLFMPDGLSGGKTWKAATADLFYGPDRKSTDSESESNRNGPGEFTNSGILKPIIRLAELVTHFIDTVVARLIVFGGYLVGLFREQPKTMRFLIARTIYADAMAALLTLGGVYAATFFGWSVAEVIINGLAGLTFGAIGGAVGGFLDRRFGPKLALVIEISALVIILTMQLSMTPESLFFGLIPADQVIWDSPVFPTLADVVYFSMIFPLAIAVVACISSSRYMLVHTAPPERIGEFFGLYAIAGTVTVWMGPGLVSLLTWLTNNQRIGIAGIGAMFLIGLLILLGVNTDKTPEHMKRDETIG